MFKKLPGILGRVGKMILLAGGVIVVCAVVFLLVSNYLETSCIASGHSNYETDRASLKTEYGNDTSVNPPRYLYSIFTSRCVYVYEYWSGLDSSVWENETVVKDGYTNQMIADFRNDSTLGVSANINDQHITGNDAWPKFVQFEIKLFGSIYRS